MSGKCKRLCLSFARVIAPFAKHDLPSFVFAVAFAKVVLDSPNVCSFLAVLVLAAVFSSSAFSADFFSSHSNAEL